MAYKPLDQCLLYGFVDTTYLRDRDYLEVTRQLCAGGVDLIQLRAKFRASEEVMIAAEQMMPVCAAAGVGLIINDFPGVAKHVGAYGCHLGQEDFFDAGLSRDVDVSEPSRPFKLGLSTHTPAQAARALEALPDYIGVGPVHSTATKLGAAAVGLEYVRWAAANVPIPWFAIGGITLDNVDPVLAAGARRIAVVSAILNAPDIVQACQSFKNRLISAATNTSR
jgi:thiamine-phosphate pyrophosphorylase